MRYFTDIALLLAVAVFGLTAAAALAESATDIDRPLMDCRTVEADDARLACYDRAVDRAGYGTDRAAANPDDNTQARSATPVDTAEPVVPVEAPEPVKPVASERPAKPTASAASESVEPSEELFGQDDSTLREAVEAATGVKIAKKVTSTIRSLGFNNRGRRVIRLENGQIWDQVDSNRITLDVGDEVVISRAAFGSYALRKSGKNRSIKVRRRSDD